MSDKTILSDTTPSPSVATAADTPLPSVESGATPLPSAEPIVATVEDWKAKIERIAAGDTKLIKVLSRYKTEEDAIKAGVKAQDRIRSGEFKVAWRPDMTPEELSTWRDDNGIPVEVKDYKPEVPAELAVGEQAQPMIDWFTKTSHDLNLHPEQSEKIMKAFAEKQAEFIAARESADQEARDSAIQKMVDEHGPKLKEVVAKCKEVLAQAPEEVRSVFLEGRTADGTRIANIPSVVSWLSSIGQKLNPDGTVVPGTGRSAMQSMQDEYDAIVKQMRDPISDYNKGQPHVKSALRDRTLTLIKAGVKTA